MSIFKKIGEYLVREDRFEAFKQEKGVSNSAINNAPTTYGSDGGREYKTPSERERESWRSSNDNS